MVNGFGGVKPSSSGIAFPGPPAIRRTGVSVRKPTAAERVQWQAEGDKMLMQTMWFMLALIIIAGIGIAIYFFSTKEQFKSVGDDQNNQHPQCPYCKRIVPLYRAN